MTDFLAEKRCSKCKTTKPVGDFGQNQASKDGLNVWCRSCRNEYYNERYAGDPKYVERRRRTTRKWLSDPANAERNRRAAREWLSNPDNAERRRAASRENGRKISALVVVVKRNLMGQAGGGCAVCGFDESTAAIDFHHENGAGAGAGENAKEFHLGNFLTRLCAAKKAGKIEEFLGVIQAEFDRGVWVLCRNCHARVHWDGLALPDGEPPKLDIVAAYENAIRDR